MCMRACTRSTAHYWPKNSPHTEFGTKSPRVGHTSGCGRATYLSITYDPQAAGSLTYLSIKRVLSYHPYSAKKNQTQ